MPRLLRSTSAAPTFVCIGTISGPYLKDQVDGWTLIVAAVSERQGLPLTGHSFRACKAHRRRFAS
jgi:hypothetical protein